MPFLSRLPGLKIFLVNADVFSALRKESYNPGGGADLRRSRSGAAAGRAGAAIGRSAAASPQVRAAPWVIALFRRAEPLLCELSLQIFYTMI